MFMSLTGGKLVNLMQSFLYFAFTEKCPNYTCGKITGRMFDLSSAQDLWICIKMLALLAQLGLIYRLCIVSRFEVPTSAFSRLPELFLDLNH